MIGTAVAAALGSALVFALATSLQHRAATATSGQGDSVGEFFRSLARRPSWHLGLILGALALVLHAIALNNAALTVVQPLVVTGIVFALPVRAALDRRLPSLIDLAWVAVTTTGIAAFVVAANPPASNSAPIGINAVPLILAGAAAAAALTRLGLRAPSAQDRGVLLGTAAGILSGLTAGTLKMTVHGGPGHVSFLALAALVLVGGWGLVVNQRSYQVAPLSLSMPVLNVVGVLVVIAFGYRVFGEIPNHRPGALLVEVMGLSLMALGVARLMRRLDIPASAPPIRPRSRRSPRSVSRFSPKTPSVVRIGSR